MNDPTDVKPAGYDDIPAKIPDPEAKCVASRARAPQGTRAAATAAALGATAPGAAPAHLLAARRVPPHAASPPSHTPPRPRRKPEDWDDEEDGEWEVPQIDNPAYKGAWSAKKIKNPDYKGPWVQAKIANPEFKNDTALYNVCAPCTHVGFELWQVKAGTIFDDIVVTDDAAEAQAFYDETFAKKEATEKATFEAAEKKKKDEEEEARKKSEAEAKKVRAWERVGAGRRAAAATLASAVTRAHADASPPSLPPWRLTSIAPPAGGGGGQEGREEGSPRRGRRRGRGRQGRALSTQYYLNTNWCIPFSPANANVRSVLHRSATDASAKNRFRSTP